MSGKRERALGVMFRTVVAATSMACVSVVYALSQATYTAPADDAPVPSPAYGERAQTYSTATSPPPASSAGRDGPSHCMFSNAECDNIFPDDDDRHH